MSGDAGKRGGENRGKVQITPTFRPAQREKMAPCQTGCATSGDVRSWIGVVAQRKKLGISRDEAYARAWHKITEVNPFPSVMGRVCPHPCEDRCNRSSLDESVAINAMERFLGDWALAKGLPLEPREGRPREESIGVVGAGPSGLSFAYQMARKGYPVTVYEDREEAGGMLRYGIPDYRLPPSVLDAEIRRILALGVELRLNVRIGTDITLDELRERHAALYLGIGAQRGRGLGIPGETGPGVLTGTEYLEGVNIQRPADVGRKVVVIGGGNTAVDAARVARRTGAEVALVYRRSRKEMPAIAHEVDDAVEEGVDLILLTAPVRLERDGRPRMQLVAQRMELGEPDASGRRRPVPIQGSEFKIETDTVIAAVSQEPNLTGLDQVSRDGGWLVGDEFGEVEPGIWAGGDALGLGIAGFAIAQGRHAAEALHRRLQGLPADAPRSTEMREVGPEAINFEFHRGEPSAKPPRIDVTERFANPSSEVSGAITEEQFLAEASRCFSCGSCFGCQQCSMYCTSGCYVKLEQLGPGTYYALSLDQCEECGKCIEVCPCGFLEVGDA